MGVLPSTFLLLSHPVGNLDSGVKRVQFALAKRTKDARRQDMGWCASLIVATKFVAETPETSYRCHSCVCQSRGSDTNIIDDPAT